MDVRHGPQTTSHVLDFDNLGFQPMVKTPGKNGRKKENVEGAQDRKPIRRVTITKTDKTERDLDRVVVVILHKSVI
jgi:hypothetical protein